MKADAYRSRMLKFRDYSVSVWKGFDKKCIIFISWLRSMCHDVLRICQVLNTLRRGYYNNNILVAFKRIADK